MDLPQIEVPASAIPPQNFLECGGRRIATTSIDPRDEAALLMEVGRGVIAEAAPEELPIYEANASAYLDNPSEYEKRRSSDDMLGFGVGEAVVLVTPVAVACLRKVMSFLIEEVLDESQKQGSTMIRDTIKRLFSRFNKPEDANVGEPVGSPAEGGGEAAAEVVRLSAEQLASVREIVLTHAERLHVPDTKATALADATVAGLAMAAG